MNAKAPLAETVGWTDLDLRAVDTVRVLAADAVEKVGNGHPGTAISLAPAAYLLYQNVLRHDPADPHWLGRDRFVLSAGHSSLTQYIQLYLAGFGLELEDLEALRTWGSKTPGHPEYKHTTGVEITTGPLGQGLASAVGFAMAARRERGLLDPEAAPGTSPFDHYVYVIASDGDLQEGVTSEASSIAGTQELGNLIVLWDDNHISIEGDTEIAFTEDVVARYEAYGWHVQFVDWTGGPDGYREDVDALHAAIEAAKAVTDRPSFIGLRTLIAWPTPSKTNDHSSHGSKLGGDAVRGLKELLGFDPEKTFEVDPEVLAHTRGLSRAHRRRRRPSGRASFDAWRAANPENAALLDRLVAGELPDGWTESLPGVPGGQVRRHPRGVRRGAQRARARAARAVGRLGRPRRLEQHDDEGRAVLHPGQALDARVRRATSSAARCTSASASTPWARSCRASALHGLTRPYGGTFFTFSDYMRGSVRLASLMGVPAIYVWTHDSIGLGEDGPTHQPIEHLAAVRAIPGLTVVRPADANETAAAWRGDPRAHRRPGRPHPHAAERPDVPARRGRLRRPPTGVARGAYVLLEASSGTPDVILIGTGLRGAARRRGARDARGRRRGRPAWCRRRRCEWFAEQDEDYRESVLPSSVRARVSVEAGIALSWHKLVGDAGRVGLDRALRRVGRRRDALPRVRLHARGRRRGRARVDRGGRGDAAPRTRAGLPTTSGTGDQQV